MKVVALFLMSLLTVPAFAEIEVKIGSTRPIVQQNLTVVLSANHCKTTMKDPHNNENYYLECLINIGSEFPTTVGARYDIPADQGMVNSSIGIDKVQVLSKYNVSIGHSFNNNTRIVVSGRNQATREDLLNALAAKELTLRMIYQGPELTTK